jgi:hypothetical protein
VLPVVVVVAVLCQLSIRVFKDILAMLEDTMAGSNTKTNNKDPIVKTRIPIRINTSSNNTTTNNNSILYSEAEAQVGAPAVPAVASLHNKFLIIILRQRPAAIRVQVHHHHPNLNLNKPLFNCHRSLELKKLFLVKAYLPTAPALRAPSAVGRMAVVMPGLLRLLLPFKTNDPYVIVGVAIS